MNIICITNRKLCQKDFLIRLEEIAKASPKAIVLREKDLSEDEYMSLASDVMNIGERYNVPVYLHYFYDVAKKLGANCIHLPLWKLDALYQKMVDNGYDSKLKIVVNESTKYEGYSYMRVYNKNASKENMLLYLKEKYEIDKMVTFGTIPEKYDVLVQDDNFNNMVRLVRHRYEPNIFN